MPDFAAFAQAGQGAAHGAHDHGGHRSKLLRMGLFTALAIAIDNFPEGIATFLAALHNIPEGISVSVPIFQATGNRKKAFTYSILSGLAEPVGADVAYLGLRLFVGGESGDIPPLDGQNNIDDPVKSQNWDGKGKSSPATSGTNGLFTKPSIFFQ